MKIFIFALLLHSLRGAQNDDIINEIMHCGYSWLGFKNSIRFRNFVNSFIDNVEGKPLPVEFKGRLLLLYHNYDYADFLKIYFKLQEEDAEVREFMDRLEEYYHHFYRKSDYHRNPGNTSWGDSGEFKDDPNEVDKVKKIVASLIHLETKLVEKWSNMRNEALNPIPIMNKIIGDILSFDKISLFKSYAFHKIGLDFSLQYSNLKLTEHGSKKTLLAQMYGFMSSPHFNTSERRRIWGSYQILHKNNAYTTLGFFDCIPKRLISIVNQIVKNQQNPDALPILEEKRLHYIKVFRHYSTNFSPDLSKTKYAKHLCSNLETHCRHDGFVELWFSTFFVICNGVNPGQIESLIQESLI
jgi:hypothetical protein